MGGNGANAAASFAKLGFRTGFVGKVGKDEAGNLILASLKNSNVSFLGSKGGVSGQSVILDAMGEDRTILAFKGCNNDLDFNEVKASKLRAKWLYLSSMNGNSLATMYRIALSASRQGASIAFNPSQTLIDCQKQAAVKLAQVSKVLVLNKEEAQSLSGRSCLEECMRSLNGLGPSTVVVTDGRYGAVAFQESTFYRIKPRVGLRIVETTGAGDAFASAFTSGLMLKKPITFCLKMAINQSESVIQGHGAQNNLLSRKKILSLTSRDKRKVEISKTLN
jgi:ribokinase